MQPVEKVNKLFLIKFCLLGILLYLGFALKVPQFVKPVQAEPLEHFATPNQKQEPKQIKKLYYKMVSEKAPEEISI
ncbi:hypothetical protein WG947_03605 [Pontibacter sp. H259]|uniref:hypothetical protein n=1 Tax=Pontibacter sp. H259 TaxID=3133421 RepID=UPI0030C4D99D